MTNMTNRKGDTMADNLTIYPRTVCGTVPVRVVRSEKTSTASSPLMLAYDRAANKLSDSTILLIRLGDFYEAFGPDADVVLSQVGTARAARLGARMTGIVYHILQESIKTLNGLGYDVHVMLQVSK